MYNVYNTRIYFKIFIIIIPIDFVFPALERNISFHFVPLRPLRNYSAVWNIQISMAMENSHYVTINYYKQMELRYTDTEHTIHFHDVISNEQIQFKKSRRRDYTSSPLEKRRIISFYKIHAINSQLL